MAESIARYIDLLKDAITSDYSETLNEPTEQFQYPFIVPGSEQYADQLWDWDSWLSNVALRQVLADLDDEGARAEALPYEKGCIRNFARIVPDRIKRLDQLSDEPGTMPKGNIRKPCFAQHAAFIVQQENGEVAWVQECGGLEAMRGLMDWYRTMQYHEPTGLYFWNVNGGVGVDDDPCSFTRPPRSTASIYLNCMMLREMHAMAYLLKTAGQQAEADGYRTQAGVLREAINEHCWDPRDGFYYSVDVNLQPAQERPWDGLIMRIGVWSGFMGLWSEAADQERAARVVEENYRNDETFRCDGGIRTLSKMEKMYLVRGSGNPSCWLGPVWGIANYMTWHGLVKYGFDDDARDLAERTIRTFGRDVENCGALHEYYQPDGGVPVLNAGFQNWNHLVLNIIAWYEGREFVSEF